MRSWRRYILQGLCLAFLAIFLIAPIVMAIRGGFMDQGRPSGYWVWRALPDVSVLWRLDSFWQGLDRLADNALFNALKVAVLVTGGVLLLAVPLAVLSDHYQFRGKNLASALLMVPMILPPFVGAFALRKLLAYYDGPVNLLLGEIGLGRVNWLGGGGLAAVVIMEVLHLYPIMFLNATAALANVDPTMTQAARNLGASRWRTFWTVTLPLIRPGLFAGGTIVFIWSFTELGTPLVFDYRQTLPVQIYDGLKELNTSPGIYAMVFLMLSSSIGLYAMGKMLFGRGASAMAGRGTAATVQKASWPMTLLIWAVFGLVTALAAVPHVGVLLLAMAKQWSGTILPQAYTADHLRAVFQNPQSWQSIVNSLQYAGLACMLDIGLGLAIAYLVVRMRVRGAWLLDSLAMLPLAVPGLVMASGYVLIFMATGWQEQARSALAQMGLVGVGEWLSRQSPANDPVMLLVVAYGVRRLPYMVRSVSAGLEQTSETLEEAARNLGASRTTTLVRVTLPLIAANLLAGAVLTFSFAMLEVSDSLILAQNPQYYPITKLIFTQSGPGTENFAAAMGSFAMLFLGAALVLANLLMGKKMGALFRV